MSAHFFEDMQGFSQFNELVDNAHYRIVPEDWWVVITDVKGSTQAVQDGRYKDVNTVGAATLVALRNAVGGFSIPFVFGGDGASALIPGEYQEAATRELSALRTMAKVRFGLTLRVGMVSVTELTGRVGPLYVAKFLLEGQFPLALFRGGALSAADTLIKQEFERYEVPSVSGAETDLRALSCRWKEIPSNKGCVLAILAADPEGNGEAMKALLTGLDHILDPDTQAANPIRRNGMGYRGLWHMLSTDRLHPSGVAGRFRRILGILLSYALFKMGMAKWSQKFGHYKEAIPQHSDFRKFDDVLRMIIDCCLDQVDAIEQLCRELREQYGLTYGLHRNSAALMTCYVPGFGDGEHVHFVDGSDGGYTFAAKQFKAQLAEATAPKNTHLAPQQIR
jgi:hypothetical protein